MIRSSLNLMVLLIVWITIFSLTSSVSGFETFTHNETNSYPTPPRMWEYQKYIDGTVVIRIINRDVNKTSNSSEVWIKQVLSLRIIHPNGTVSEIDKDLEIQEFNFRITRSSGGFFDPVIWITIFSLTSSVSGFETFTHNETNSYPTPPRMWEYQKYIDGTVVIRIINRDVNKTSNSSEVWIKQVLSLRIIHPNGTVSEIDKDLEIQEFNFRITRSSGGFFDPVSVYALQRGFLIVTYFNASNPDDINTYEEWGRIIDWNGNLYEKKYFSKAYINNGKWYPSLTTIVTNVDPSKGFIRIVGTDISYIEWQQYMIGDSFHLKKLSEGNITLLQKNGTFAIFNIVPTADEGYSIIMGNSTSTNSDNLLEIYATVYYLKIGYNLTQFGAPKLLYQSSLPNITISNIFCGISNTQVCVLDVIQSVTQNNVTSSKNYYVKLDFLSSGSVIKITPLNNLPELPPNSVTGWQIEDIPYGGYLFYGYFLNATTNQTNTYGYYYNEIENEYSKWEFDNPSLLNLRGILLILPNNTLLVSQIESNNTWSFNITNIPNYSGNWDHGYSNLLIDSTSPSINASIPNISNLTDMGNITITYIQPVELSDGNIWIYRIDNSVTQNVTRQFVNANNNDFCSVSDNGLTLTVKVIRSTFSYPNSQFYVKVDNNFVRSKVYGEPLKGINDNIWNFNTFPIEEESFASGSESGVMRLTIEGAQYYKKLNSTGQDDFIYDLRTELSKIISVNIERLSSSVKNLNHQIFISLKIQSSEKERSVKSIIDDLNNMIKYKRITAISLFPNTNYLDEEFGSVPKQNLWEKYKIIILGVVLAFGILVVLFLLAHKKERKGHNMAVLQLGLIIFDFVINALFFSYNGKVVEELYIPSLMFLTVPTVVNAIWAFYIIFDENKSKTFLDWFAQHLMVALIFTVLSGADIEALSILHSNMAGFEFFNAPFSTKGKNSIFWASCLNIFVKDIPQVIIQVSFQILYMKK
ncbi:hypothetical protein Glove_85g122 [Diversispora epigaea]|uniref:Uncharacterized protein n=1 Tax=Diversispora epigaea TaxID=1348612 RepID=A0A397JBB4_9GLOM|nr:hypothetical protein Glove_85g122 [Diversispora epigaea]